MNACAELATKGIAASRDAEIIALLAYLRSLGANFETAKEGGR